MKYWASGHGKGPQVIVTYLDALLEIGITMRKSVTIMQTDEISWLMVTILILKKGFWI